MRKIVALVLFCAMLTLSGCAIHMNSEYSDLLGKTAAWSDEVADRAESRDLTEAQMVKALRTSAKVWDEFYRARWEIGDE